MGVFEETVAYKECIDAKSVLLLFEHQQAALVAVWPKSQLKK